ncbi:AAA family ATPase [Actinoplanes sp. CA-142083]|uniref:AAA family ATPase n=1 Tax=Actinoplanes sp. CA-142083 TaxID=3239903 RepID=UPI003D90D40C
MTAALTRVEPHDEADTRPFLGPLGRHRLAGLAQNLKDEVREWAERGVHFASYTEYLYVKEWTHFYVPWVSRRTGKLVTDFWAFPDEDVSKAIELVRCEPWWMPPLQPDVQEAANAEVARIRSVMNEPWELLHLGRLERLLGENIGAMRHPHADPFVEWPKPTVWLETPVAAVESADATALEGLPTNYESEAAMTAPLPPPVPTESLSGAERALRVMDLDAFLDMPSPEWLIADFLDSGFSYMTGGSNTGKTFVGVDMACQLPIGGNWHGLPIPKPLSVLYLAAEDPAGVAGRVRAWIKRYASANDRIALKERLSFTADTPSLIDPVDRQRLIRSAVEYDLVIIDTQTDVTSGINENSKSEMDALLVTMKAIVDAGGSVLMIHHPNLGEDSWKPRGIGTQVGKANTVIQVKPANKDKPNGPIAVVTKKQKHSRRGKKRVFAIEEVGDSAVLVEVDVRGGSEPVWLAEEAVIRALCELGHGGVGQVAAGKLQQEVSDYILKHGWNPDLKSKVGVRELQRAAKTLKDRLDDAEWTGSLWVAPPTPDEPEDDL